MRWVGREVLPLMAPISKSSPRISFTQAAKLSLKSFEAKQLLTDAEGIVALKTVAVGVEPAQETKVPIAEP
jgi:hypothetical protein